MLSGCLGKTFGVKLPRAPAVRGSFQVVIDEIDETIVPEKVRKVIVCAGKVYYDLLAERRKREIPDIAVIRLKQLYPFPAKGYEACLLC